jgi:hypothetical protein
LIEVESPYFVRFTENVLRERNDNQEHFFRSLLKLRKIRQKKKAAPQVAGLVFFLVE